MTRDEGKLWFEGLLAAEAMHKELGLDPVWVAVAFSSSSENGDEEALIAMGAEDYRRHAYRLTKLGLS
jgi:hypothetical protein